jgi:2-hydroxycyclohexanecarboxyl-CoA dehydrogenase
MDLGLSGHTVIVTGGAGGLGRDMCRAFAREGAKLVIADLHDGSSADGVSAEQELRDGGADAMFVRTDITAMDQVEQLVATAEQTFGPVEVLVNNAAWWPMPHTFFWDEDPADWRKMLDVIVIGTLNCSKAVTAGMRSRGRGSIINIVSDAALKGESRETTYSAAKAAVVGLTRSLALGLGPSGIRVNALAPGRTMTPLFHTTRAAALAEGGDVAATYLDREKRALRLYPLRKFGTPEDVGNMVVSLASPALSGHVTGQVVSVSGGYRVG